MLIVIDALQYLSCIFIAIIGIPCIIGTSSNTLRIMLGILMMVGFYFSWDIGYFLYDIIAEIIAYHFIIAILFTLIFIGPLMVIISPIAAILRWILGR